MKTLPCLTLALALLSTAAHAQQLTLKAEKPQPTYKIGEPVVWNLQVTGDGSDQVKEVRYNVKRDALTSIAKGALPLQNGTARLETKLDAPGTLMADFTFNKTSGPEVHEVIGAVVAPAEIKPSMDEPPDFMTFWKSKIQELASVPPAPVLTPLPSGTDGVNYWQITLDNIRGTKIHGQLAEPGQPEGKFPAMVILQYAGVYGLGKERVVPAAKDGWLVLNINPHDLPIDQSPEFYKQQADGPLKNYSTIGNDDPDKSYFLRMILSAYRAVDYLKSRSDWDGKTLVVTGNSQGGMQSLMMGGLHPGVTAVVVCVPAGCDNTGQQVGRATPWPNWALRAKDNPKIAETSRYYDALNFARHIKATTLIGVGLADTTATAPGVIAAFNQIPATTKKLVVMERGDHQGLTGTHVVYTQNMKLWLQALAKHNPVPTAP